MLQEKFIQRMIIFSKFVRLCHLNIWSRPEEVKILSDCTGKKQTVIGKEMNTNLLLLTQPFYDLLTPKIYPENPLGGP